MYKSEDVGLFDSDNSSMYKAEDVGLFPQVSFLSYFSSFSAVAAALGA